MSEQDDPRQRRVRRVTATRTPRRVAGWRGRRDGRRRRRSAAAGRAGRGGGRDVVAVAGRRCAPPPWRPGPPAGPAQTATAGPRRRRVLAARPRPRRTASTTSPTGRTGRADQPGPVAGRPAGLCPPGRRTSRGVAPPRGCPAAASGRATMMCRRCWPDPGYADLDGDGATETVALVGCRFGEASAKQLVAFDRDAPAGSSPWAGWSAPPQGWTTSPSSTYGRRARYGYTSPTYSPAATMPELWAPQRQWRTYTWTGGGFTPTDAGRESFGSRPPAD